MTRAAYTMLLVLALGCEVVSGTDQESLYSQLTRAVIRLEGIETILNKQGTPQTRLHTGTAFFVRTGHEIFVVTARHVVGAGYNMRSRVQLQNYETRDVARFVLELPHGDWVYHPGGGDEDTHFVDVAAMKICIPTKHVPKCFRYEPADPNMQKDNQLPSVDAEPPEPVLVFGFPSLVGFTLSEQRPIGRFGIISMGAGDEFLTLEVDGAKKFAEERCYLIDARMFPGNSGGPVMNQIRLGNARPRLLGLVSATTRSLDFGIIEPVSRIRETLDQAKTRPASGRWKVIADIKATAEPEVLGVITDYNSL
ncbi:MAG: trypsin-like peptidase domain-containing protein [Phycisphaerae bacterium]|nr:trypsin-like peptidase domain-containing protein [Phycisphaerae bacterium]